MKRRDVAPGVPAPDGPSVPTLITAVGGPVGCGTEAASVGDWAADDITTTDKYRTAFLHAVHRETRGALVESIVADLVPPFRAAMTALGMDWIPDGLRLPLKDEDFRAALLAWSVRWNLPARPRDLLDGRRIDEAWVWVRLGAGLARYGMRDETLAMRWTDHPTRTGAERIVLDPSDVTWIVSGAHGGTPTAQHPQFHLPEDLRAWWPTNERRTVFLGRVNRWLTDVERGLRDAGYHRAPREKAESLLSPRGVPHRHLVWLARHQVLGMTWGEVADTAKSESSTVRRACVAMARHLPLTFRTAPGRRSEK